MLKLFLKVKKNRKGFTLTELVVVLAIIGVLTAIVTPVVSGYIEDAKIRADQATASTIESAIKIAVAVGRLDSDTDGVVDEEATDEATLTAIKSAISDKIGSAAIPAPQNEGYHFYLDYETGNVACDESMPTGYDLQLDE